MNQMWGESIFVMDLSGVQSVVTAGIILTLQLCVESWGTQLMVSPYIVYIQDNKIIKQLSLALADYHHALQVHNHSITPLMKMILL